MKRYPVYIYSPPWVKTHVANHNDGKPFIEEGDVFCLDPEGMSFRIYENVPVRKTNPNTGIIESITRKPFSQFLEDGLVLFSTDKCRQPTIIHLNDRFDFNLVVDVSDVAILTP